MSRAAARIACTSAVAIVAGLLGASPSWAALSATAEIAGSGTTYSLEVANTGDTTIARIAFTPAAGVQVTGAGGPGEPGPAPAGGFGRTGLSIAPGQRAAFPFTTAAPYPVGAGGVLEVAAARGGFVRVQVTGPGPAPGPPAPSPAPAPPSSAPGLSPPPLQAPLEGGDGDGDRVANGRDLCPRTPKGFRLVERGCSVADLIVDPTGLLDARRASLQETRRLLSQFPGLRAGAGLARLGRAMRRLEIAAAELARNPCRSRRLGRAADTLTRRGLAAIGTATRREQKQAAKQAARFRARVPKGHADIDGFTLRVYELAARADGAAETAAELQGMNRLLGLACRASAGRGSGTGTIESLDPAAQVAELSDGTTVHFGAAEHAQALIPGARVKATGVRLNSNVLVADSIAALNLTIDPSIAPCSADWTVAPVQDFADWQDVLYFDRRGYTNGGLYLLESGMAIGATFSAQCGSEVVHAVHVSIEYQTKSGVQKSKLWA